MNIWKKLEREDKANSKEFIKIVKNSNNKIVLLKYGKIMKT